jgi:hypothetical protein
MTKPKAQVVKPVGGQLHRTNGHLKQFDAPEDIFGPGKYVKRLPKLKTKTVDRLKKWNEKDETGFYQEVARLIPEWNLDDCETGEPLPQPKDDPSVFTELEVAQEFKWVFGLLNQ